MTKILTASPLLESYKISLAGESEKACLPLMSPAPIGESESSDNGVVDFEEAQSGEISALTDLDLQNDS